MMNNVPDISKIKTFYINLKHDIEKTNKFIKNDFIKYKRFPAVYGKKYKDNKTFIDKISLLTQSKIHLKKRGYHEDLTSIGAVGCSLSHYYIWKSFLDEKIDDEYLQLFNDDHDEMAEIKNISFSKTNTIEDEYLLIFEDDIYISDLNKFKSQIQNDINELLKYNIDWDIILLTTLKVMDSNNLNINTNGNFSKSLFNSMLLNLNHNNNCNEKYCEIKMFIGMQNYIIKRSAIKKIIESKMFFPIECHIDIFLGLLSQKKILKIISTENKNIYHNRIESLLASNISENIPIVEYILLIIIIILIGIMMYFVRKVFI